MDLQNQAANGVEHLNWLKPSKCNCFGSLTFLCNVIAIPTKQIIIEVVFRVLSRIYIEIKFSPSLG